MTNVRFLGIVTVADQVEVNADVRLIIPEANEIFDVPLYSAEDPDGSITHYWSSGQVSEETYVAMEALKVKYPDMILVPYDLMNQKNFPEEKLIELKLSSHSRHVDRNTGEKVVRVTR